MKCGWRQRSTFGKRSHASEHDTLVMVTNYRCFYRRAAGEGSSVAAAIRALGVVPAVADVSFTVQPTGRGSEVSYLPMAVSVSISTQINMFTLSLGLGECFTPRINTNTKREYMRNL